MMKPSTTIQLRVYAARAMHDAAQDDEYPMSKAELRRALEMAYRALYDIANDLIPRGKISAPAEDPLCSDCPPHDYPTQKTRCLSCPRRRAA